MLVIITKKGQVLKIKEQTIRVMSRGCQGVKGIKLNLDDEVAGIVAIKEEGD